MWPATPCVPTVTLLGLNIAYLIGSTVIVEQVFNLNGLGSLLLSSILNRDFPVVQATTLVLGTGVVLVNFGHRPAGQPPRPEDPVAMTALVEPAGPSRRRYGWYRSVFLRRASRSPTFIAGSVITIGLVLIAALAPGP